MSQPSELFANVSINTKCDKWEHLNIMSRGGGGSKKFLHTKQENTTGTYKGQKSNTSSETILLGGWIYAMS